MFKEEDEDKELLVFENLPKGRQFPPVSETLTSERIRNFARAIGTENPFYVCEEYAARSRFGTLIAPPMIAYLLFRRSYLAHGVFPGAGIAVKMEFQFLKAARVNETLTTTTTVADSYEREGKKYVTLESVTINKDAEKVYVTRLYAIWPK